jgi:hypothetical protein
MSSYVPADLRRLVGTRSQGLCDYCLLHEDDMFYGCQVEHIIAEKHGGLTTAENLAAACVFCNRAKGTDIATISPATGHLCRLFHPRQDRWSDHFRVDGTIISGISDVGESTAMLLGFNLTDRLLEREALAAIGRFPCKEARLRLSAR